MTVLHTRPDDPGTTQVNAVVDLGSGTGPQWLEVWLAEHAP